jgi:hypothetical protein
MLATLEEFNVAVGEMAVELAVGKRALFFKLSGFYFPKAADLCGHVF